MTEIELIAFLKSHLQLKINESHQPFDAANCKKIEVVLSLAMPDKTHVISKDFFKISEDLR